MIKVLFNSFTPRSFYWNGFVEFGRLTQTLELPLFIYLFYLFKQYLDKGAQFSEAGLNGALFNINLLTNNILNLARFYKLTVPRERIVCSAGFV